MSKPKRGLGSSLLGQGAGSDVDTVLRQMGAPGEVREEIRTVDPRTIDPAPWQPRKVFKPEELRELANSVQERGVLLPLLVRPKPDGRWELLAGERRQRAAMLVGRNVPVRILDVSDTVARVVTFTENAQRENLTAWEEAQSVAALRDTLREAGEPATGEALARLTGWSTAKISQRLTIADAITPTVSERAEVEIYAVNQLPKISLLSIAQAEDEAERARLLRIATGAERTPGAAELAATEATGAKKPKRGRPPKPYAVRGLNRGRFRLEIHDAAALDKQAAREILDKLEPVLVALRERAHSKQEDLDL